MFDFIIPVPEGSPRFANFPRCNTISDLDAQVAIIGIDYKSAYNVSIPEEEETTLEHSHAPKEIRKHSLRYAKGLRNFDYDFGGDIFNGKNIKIVDCGDFVFSDTIQNDIEGIAAVIKAILEKGVVPIVLGGDHGTPIPVLYGYSDHAPLCVVQIDAHLDYRDERDGFKEGFSSGPRRAAEMSWVDSLMQIGLRGIGSSTLADDAAARKAGSIIITAEELHRKGVAAVLDMLPQSENYYITIDADGLDPSLAPGVFFPSPGGLTYYETNNLIKGIAKRGRICGVDITELIPRLDIQNLSSIFMARIILNIIGIMAHSGQL